MHAAFGAHVTVLGQVLGHPAGVEIAVLEAEIDVRADRHASAEDRLPCPGAIAFAEQLDTRTAETAAAVERQAVIVPEVEQGVDHAGKHADLAVEVEIGRGQRRQRIDGIRSNVTVGTVQPRVQRGYKPAVDFQLVDIGTLVSKLALDPEQPEIVAGNGVDIVALLIVDAEGIIERRVGRAGDRRGGRYGLRRRIVDEDVGILVLREEDAALNPDIDRAVPGSRWRCDRSNRNGGEKIFMHAGNPFAVCGP